MKDLQVEQKVMDYYARVSGLSRDALYGDEGFNRCLYCLTGMDIKRFTAAMSAFLAEYYDFDRELKRYWRRGPKVILDPRHQMLMAMVRLRRHASYRDLGEAWGVHNTTARRAVESILPLFPPAHIIIEEFDRYFFFSYQLHARKLILLAEISVVTAGFHERFGLNDGYSPLGEYIEGRHPTRRKDTRW